MYFVKMYLYSILLITIRHIKGMIRLRPEQVWTCSVNLHVHTCCHDTVLRYAVTLQVWTHLYMHLVTNSHIFNIHRSVHR